MSEWQPIETAPRDGTPVWACNAKHGYENKAAFMDGEWECINWQGFLMGVGFFPTHWMPLPDPPALTDAEGTKA